jgi:mycothiol synthase
MRVVEITQAAATDRRQALVAFVQRLADAAGSRPLSDHLWLDLQERAGAGSISVSAADESGIIALAQIARANEGSVLEVVVDPALDDAADVHDDVLETAIDAFRGAGGGHLTWWTDVDDPGAHDIAEQSGLRLERSLHEMRVPLPLSARATVTTRAFTPDDVDAWLRVNNRAFAQHPEHLDSTLLPYLIQTSLYWVYNLHFTL